ncbi:hypothetical protein TacPo2_1 [Pantoea bacteriophage TacPo2]
MSVAATAAFLCMTLVIHEEARGEPIAVKYEVGHVVKNRMDSRQYPDTCEAVVLQPKQFSWTKTRNIRDEYDLRQRYYRVMDNLDTDRKRRAFADSQKAAQAVIEGKHKSRFGRALHFVTRGHSTKWASNFKRYTIAGMDFLLPRTKDV